jgi:hypothetical protein
MAEFDAEIKQDDTWPPIGDAVEPVVLSDARGVINLTGATVKFFAKHENGTDTIDGDCAILTAAEGEIAYNWTLGDTAIAGQYTFEFQITFGDGRKATVPTQGYKSLMIHPDLGD